MKIFFLLCTLFLATTAFAQKTAIKGTVTDSAQVPIVFANVVAMLEGSQKIASIGVTDGEGKFLLKLHPDSSYWVVASFIGYQKYEQKIVPKNLQKPLAITLYEDTTQLEEVEIVEELPITISGDTISYKVDKFTKGNERKLEDVLNELPGFETDAEGEVKFQGQKIDQLMVDGKKFFDGSTKMATKNMPAKVVDKVQLLRNYTDAAPMQQVGNEDRLAINIALKEDSKKMVFGDVSAAAGTKQSYHTHANMFYYSPKTAINLIGDANTIGKPSFTFNDYLNFNGGIGSMLSSNGRQGNSDWGNLGFATANAKNAEELQNTMLALNATHQLSEAWQLSAYTIGSITDVGRNSRSFRQILLQESQLEETLFAEDRQQFYTGLGRLEATFTPNASFHLQTKTFAKVADTQGADGFLSLSNSEQQQSASATAALDLDLSQSLQLYYSPDSKNLLALEGMVAHKKQQNQLDLTTETPLFPQLLSADYRVLNQSRDFEKQSANGRADYFRLLNPKTHLNFLLGADLSRQYFSSGLEAPEAKALAENALTFNLLDVFSGLGIKAAKGGFLVEAQAILHHINLAIAADATEEQNTQYIFTPSAMLRYQISKGQRISAKYERKMQFFDAEQLAPSTIISSFNTARAGNIGLQNALLHQWSLNYSWLSLFSGFNFYSGLVYQQKIDDLTNAVQPFGRNRLLQPFNLNKPTKSTVAYANLSKKWEKFQVGAKANLNLLNGFNLIDDALAESQSVIQSYDGSLSTTLLGKLYLTFGANMRLSQYENGQVSSRFTTLTPYAKLDIELLKGLELNMNYEYTNYQNQRGNTNSTYDFLEAELVYQKEKSPWQFRLAAQNLTGTNSIRTDNFSANLISTSQIFVIPRQVMVGVVYQL